DDGTFHNFIRNPNGTFTNILQTDTAAIAFGINSANTVVGMNGLGQAIQISSTGTVTTLFQPATNNAPSAAFGINDKGTIVGQYTVGGQTPGFLKNGSNLIRLDAPSGPDTVNAQGINNNGLVVGFYVGTDGQDHGFKANPKGALNGQLTGTAIADPTIPNV